MTVTAVLLVSPHLVWAHTEHGFFTFSDSSIKQRNLGFIGYERKS